MNHPNPVLVAGRSYFGLDALLFQRGIQRMGVRLASAADDPRRVTAQTLAHDFELDGAGAAALVKALRKGGLLESGEPGAYKVTDRFRAYAAAHVLPALQRAKAKELLDQIVALAAEINATWTRNPLKVAGLAISGSYMHDTPSVPELVVWVLLELRVMDPSQWRQRSTKAHGAKEIRTAIRAFSPIVSVRLITDLESVERPFFIAFDAQSVVSEASGPIAVLRERLAALGRR